ncbi:MAG: hypothetical protein NVSMB9_12850 [Isosphaeraceae bacterium]
MADVFRPMIKGRKSTYYYGKVRDPNTKKWKKLSLDVTDKQVARRKLKELQQRTELVSSGMLDPLKDVPITRHLSDFVRNLEHKGRSESYRLQIECEIFKVAYFCANMPVPARFDRKRLDDYRSQLTGIHLGVLTVEKVDEFMAALPAEKSSRTRNSYRTSLVGLFSFLVGKRKLAYNPMLVVTRHEGVVKRKRRALTPEQLQELIVAAKARPLAQTMTIHRGERTGRLEAKVSPEVREQRERNGLHRALIYMTAFYTGLRRKELRSLRVKHLQITGDIPHIHLPGDYTKNGVDARIPIAQSLAGHLEALIQGRGAEDLVFHFPKYDELLKSLKKDLAFAGIPYLDDLGRVFDFHSLRKSLGTHLRRAKIDPSVSQIYMRHSDIRLTMEVYNDDRLHDLRAEVVEKLPTLEL